MRLKIKSSSGLRLMLRRLLCLISLSSLIFVGFDSHAKINYGTAEGTADVLKNHDFIWSLTFMLTQTRVSSVIDADRSAAVIAVKTMNDLKKFYKKAISDAIKAQQSKKPWNLEKPPQDVHLLGEAEHKVNVALTDLLQGASTVMRSPSSTSLLMPLDAVCLDVAIALRRNLVSLHTEVPELESSQSCRGDMLADRLLWRYCRAAFAEDYVEARTALTSIQAQAACLSTRQLQQLEKTLFGGLLESKLEAFAQSVGPESKRSLERLSSRLRQAFAPLALLLGDLTRHFRHYSKPALHWVNRWKPDLMNAALQEGTLLNQMGLLVYNRYNSKIQVLTRECIASPQGLNLFRGPRGISQVLLFNNAIGDPCNPLGAFINNAANSMCDLMHMVPSGKTSALATGFSCNPGCDGLPSATGGGSSLADLNAAAGKSSGQIQGSGFSSVATGSPGFGSSSTGDASTGDVSAVSQDPYLLNASGGCTSQGFGAKHNGGGGGAAGSAPGGQACDAGALSFDPQSQTSPGQAYNNSLDHCMQQMTSQPIDFNMLSNVGPGSMNPACGLADGATDDGSLQTAAAGQTKTSDTSADKNDTKDGNDKNDKSNSDDKTKEKTAEENFNDAKIVAEAIFKALASVFNGFLNATGIGELNDHAIAVGINRIALAKLVPPDSPEMTDNNAAATTNAKTADILVSAGACQTVSDCVNALVHEGLHAATIDQGIPTTKDGQVTVHLATGSDTDSNEKWINDALQLMKGGPSDCAPDIGSCSSGCTGFDTGLGGSCQTQAWAALEGTLHQQQFDAGKCAKDACPNSDTSINMQEMACGTVSAGCAGNAVALCPEENPSCGCMPSLPGQGGMQFGLSLAWRNYCAHANDDRCDSSQPPTGWGPGGGGDNGGSPPQPGPDVSNVGLASGIAGKASLITNAGGISLSQTTMRLSSGCQADITTTSCAGLHGAW